MKKLTVLRKVKGLKQEEMAKIVDVARSTYAKWEAGTHKPNAEDLIKLADFFNISLDYLLDRELIRADETLTDEETHMLLLYRVAEERDRELVDKVLERYEPQDCGNIRRLG
ncbi:hypothetical protein FACS18949_08890 [Clostridia bacterium]|nr:hypothetical protein FACS18949_08890 [Clostridia bacterium]